MNKVIEEKIFSSGKKLQIVLGDLTIEDVDAIVNAANSQLSHGGGVAGVIVRNGGRIIQEESSLKAPIPTGSAVFTTAGSLPSKFVIHAVGPIFGEGEEDDKLTAAIQSALRIGTQLKISSISFPAISSGIFGFPKDRCAEIFLKVIEEYLENSETTINLIRLCNIDSLTVNIFQEKFNEKFNI